MQDKLQANGMSNNIYNVMNRTFPFNKYFILAVITHIMVDMMNISNKQNHTQITVMILHHKRIFQPKLFSFIERVIYAPTYMHCTI